MYATLKKNNEYQVVFWNTSNNADERQIKTMRNVEFIKGCDEYCMIVCKSDEDMTNVSGGTPHSKLVTIHLCNDIGGPVDKREVLFSLLLIE